MRKDKILCVIGVVFVMLLISAPVFAGGGGTEFDTLKKYITDLVQGGLGRTVAIAAVAVGAMMSVARVNPIPALAGIGFAIFEQYTPDIIEGIMQGLV